MVKEQVIEEFKDVFLHEQIGGGAFRDVYLCGVNGDYVVKIEKASETFSNVMEYKIWEEVQCTPFEKWFAPCLRISENGSILIQKKAYPVQRDKLPEKVPYFFTDVKPENFGFIGKQLVCFDYGSILMSRTWSLKRMRKANWDDFFTDNPIR